MLKTFVKLEHLNLLSEMELPEETFERKDMRIEFIDLNVYGTVSFDENDCVVKVFDRNMFGESTEPVMEESVNFEKFANTDHEQLIKIVLVFALDLNHYFAHIGLLEKDGILAENEGILVESDGEEISARVVAGEERPDLLCSALFGMGEPQMARPYMDDIGNAFSFNTMSLEERIEAANNGDEAEMEFLALAYLNGDEQDIDENPEQSVYWFTKLAELDDAGAQFNLGLLYAKGHGVARDFEKAAYWMKRAADNGDDDASPLAEKYSKAAEAVKNIDECDAQAQADLAGVLMEVARSLDQAGTDEEDYRQAFELATKSAKQNNGDGIWTLALAYEHGRGVDEDVSKAIELYQKGAAIGHAPSQHSLACYYLRGDVLEKDSKKGFELCLKSAEQGYGLAMRDIGRCYQFGNGVEEDMNKAIEWFEKALEVIDDDELENHLSFLTMLQEGGAFDEDDESEE